VLLLLLPTCALAVASPSAPSPGPPPSLLEEESAGPPLLDPLFPLPPQMALAPPRRSRLVRRFPALLSLPVPLLMLLQSP
jgi:hypothetical protein